MLLDERNFVNETSVLIKRYYDRLKKYAGSVVSLALSKN